MAFYITFLILSAFLCTFSVIHYFLYAWEQKVDLQKPLKIRLLIKYSLICLLVSIIILFLLNFNIISRSQPNPEYLVFGGISMLLCLFSVIVFILSFYFKENYAILLDYPSRAKARRGTIKLGRIINGNKKKYNFLLNIEDLAHHMFVCGITGTGKSNFLQNLLLDFTKKYDIPFLITEFKGEYHFLQRKIPDLLIIKPGENFSINIFDPEGADPQIHAERVFKIFESGGLLENIDYSPQMERVFVDILNDVCPHEESRNWETFFSISEKHSAEQHDLTFKKSIFAIENRIRKYSISTLKDIFAKKSGLDVKELFNHKVLLDLSSIIRLGGEKEDALFFLNMILKYLWDKNIEKGSKDYQGIKHITIIEDAQYFAPQELSNRTKLTSYIEDTALLLRGTGECLISLATRPNISNEILANCGVLVSFQNHMQKALMQELLNLTEEQKEYLSMLKRGRCIIRINSIEKPFLLKVPCIERSWLGDNEIREQNKKILEKKLETSEPNKSILLLEDKRIFVKPYCKFCGKELTDGVDYCGECSTKLNDDNDFKEFEAFINKLI